MCFHGHIYFVFDMIPYYSMLIRPGRATTFTDPCLHLLHLVGNK